MIAFDYWHSPRTPLLRVSSWRIPAHLQVPMAALCCSCCVVSGAWAIEHTRLKDAVTLEKRYEQQMDAQGRRLRAAQSYALRVKRLVDLDSQVRAIVFSGIRTARRLVGLANNLPQNVWLTEVTPQPDGLQIAGRSSDLPSIASTLETLARDSSVGVPTFENAEIIKGAAQLPPVRFSMRVQYGNASR